MFIFYPPPKFEFGTGSDGWNIFWLPYGIELPSEGYDGIPFYGILALPSCIGCNSTTGARLLLPK